MITRPPVTAAAASRLGGNRVKVFVSSTSRDLSEYRAAAIRSLRRLGHQVTAMEEFTATAAYPLDRVLELVRDADAYVVIGCLAIWISPRDCPGEASSARVS